LQSALQRQFQQIEKESLQRQYVGKNAKQERLAYSNDRDRQSDESGKIGHDQLEWPVTMDRNHRSPSFGMSVTMRRNMQGFDIRRMWCRTTCRASMKACEKRNIEWGAGRILKR